MTDHNRFADAVIAALTDRDALLEFEQVLEILTENGWTEVATALREILDGRRDGGILDDLEGENHELVVTVLNRIEAIRDT